MVLINYASVCLLVSDKVSDIYKEDVVINVLVMNKSSSEEQSSCKRQENGDVPSSSERPLKKARFAWQVKGKYHLKNEISDNERPSVTKTQDTERAGSSSDSENDTNDLVGNTEQNLEILGDYLLKQDFNTLDSVITDSDKSLLKPCPTISAGKLSYPRYVSSCEGGMSSQSSSSSSRDTLSSIPMSMVHQSPSFSEDQCIARWQARQMAKGFVDNTINRVLDSWMVAPMPTVMDDNRFLALDVAEFINNLPGDNSIENEGILMAISAHGLQNTSNSSTSSVGGCNKRDQTGASMDSVKTNVFPSPPSSPMLSDEETIQEFSNAIRESKENSANTHPTCETKSFQSVNDSFDQNPFGKFLYPNASGSSSKSEDQKTSYYDDSISPHDEDMFLSTDHFDFMDAAVSFAIQNKGLTSYGTHYG